MRRLPNIERAQTLCNRVRREIWKSTYTPEFESKLATAEDIKKLCMSKNSTSCNCHGFPGHIKLEGLGWRTSRWAPLQLQPKVSETLPKIDIVINGGHHLVAGDDDYVIADIKAVVEPWHLQE